MSTVNFNMLTSKQKKIYSAIESYIKQNGIPPTVREIGEMVGEKTPGAVQGILNRLEQKGVIKRQVGMARSIQLVSQESTLYADPVYIPEIKKISQRNIDDLLNIYNIVKYQPFPPDMVSSHENCFLIKCPDNSLYESGFRYGDMLLASMETKDLRSGDILLVLYENRILLRQYQEGKNPDTVLLKADTDLIGKETFNINEIRIAGKVMAKFTVL